MPSPSRKGIAILLLVAILTILLAFIPNLLSGDVDTWLKAHAGEKYKFVLLALLPFCAVVLVLLTTDVGKHFISGIGNKSADLAPGTPDPELVAKVRKYLTERYDHRLSQKMAGRQPANLRILPSKTGTSKEGAENYITLQEEEVRAAIGDIFTRANGRLLLVGLPGAGKTTLVLQLALHLLERPGSSMPVVLNLATWRAEFKTFEEWLRKILPTELGASTGLAEQIRKHTPLILLLDGLDEVPETDRDSLLSGIGEYGSESTRQFLISSRIAEYAVTQDAPVFAQVEVAPLTLEQVELGLAATANIQPESKRLLNALKTDPLLRSAVENPFYLNTAQLLFAPAKNWSDFGFVATDVVGRQRELVERFISGAFGGNVQHKYPADKAEHWLSFLASRMTERNMVVFELKELGYDWWKWPIWQLILALMTYGLVIGLTYGFSAVVTTTIIFWFSFGLSNNLYLVLNVWLVILIVAQISVLMIGLIRGLYDITYIYTKDNLNWHWKHVLKITRNSLPFSLFAIILAGLAGGLLLGLIGLALGVLSGVLFVGIVENYINNYSSILQITTPYQRFTASAKNLHFSILQHLLLRYQLYRAGLLPFRLVTFLNELSARHILETDGATWRFRHRILQEWFAGKWVEPEENKSKTE